MLHFPAHLVSEIKTIGGEQMSVVTFRVPGGLHVELIPVSIIRQHEPLVGGYGPPPPTLRICRLFQLLIEAYEKHVSPGRRG